MSRGLHFVTFAEGPTKTRQGSLRVKHRSVTPKMFATGQAKCPVSLFKAYLNRRPDDMKTSGPFYFFSDRQSNDWNLFQKAANGEKYDRHGHEENERKLISERRLS